MKKFLITLTLLTILLPYALYPMNAQARIVDYAGNSTFGSCDATDPHEGSFRLDLTDDENYIERLILAPDLTEPAPFPYPISFVSLFESSGLETRFYFSYYDPMSSDHFNFTIGSPDETTYNNIPEPKNTYSRDYIIDPDRNIRLLKGSYIEMVESDDGIFSGSDDPIRLSIQYDGQVNRMRLAPGDNGTIGISEGDCDLDFDMQNVAEKLEGEFLLSIPLKKVMPEFTTKWVNNIQVVAKPDNSSNLNKPVISETKAKITFSEDGIFFQPWLSDDGVTPEAITEEEEAQSEPVKYGLEGNGLLLPEKGEFKGLSTNTSLEDAIVGLTNFVLGFVSVIAVIMLIYGGYLWIVDMGEDHMAEKSRKVIANAIIGILLIISAYTIVNTVVDMNNAYPEGCEIGVDYQSGNTSVDLDCGSGATNAMIGAGLSGIGSLFN